MQVAVEQLPPPLMRQLSVRASVEPLSLHLRRDGNSLGAQASHLLWRLLRDGARL